MAAHAEVLAEAADLERVRRLLLARYKISYGVVMLFYRLGRRLRGNQPSKHPWEVRLTSLTAAVRGR